MAKKSREINIFHFSFLDILFNTIGAVTFIFMIYAVMTNNLVEERNSARIEYNKQLEKIEKTKKDIENLKEKEKHVKEELEQTEKEIKEKESLLKRAKTDIRKQKVKLKKKDKTISQLKKMVTSMDKGTGIDTSLDPALMAEWGEAGGSEATKISGQIIGGNIESIIVTSKGDDFQISSLNISNTEKLNRWLLYYDKNNQNIQFLSDSKKSNMLNNFNDILFQASDSIGTGLISKRDLYYPSKFIDGKNEYDNNNDNVPDDIWYDLNNDGLSDKLEKDIDFDGIIDEAYFHFDSKNRRWKTKLVDINKDGSLDTAFIDSNTDNDKYEIRIEGFNPKTGMGKVKYEDQDLDGIYDTKWIDINTEDKDWEEVYKNFNKEHKRWTFVSIDTNNDSIPDVLLKDNDLTNDNYEEKEVDNDYDGAFDSRWMDLETLDSDWEAYYKHQDETTGFWKEVFFDTTGDGKWDVHGINTNMENEAFELLFKDEDGDLKYEVRLEDNNSDGNFELRFEDRDKDGKFEIKLELDPNTSEYIEVDKKSM